MVVCTLLGVFWAKFIYVGPAGLGVGHRDFAQMWYAARTILHGGNPYAVMGPGRLFDSHWPWYYPLTAGLAAIPVAPFSEATAHAVMVCVSAAAFGWALTASGWWPLLAFGSICMWQAMNLAQWSPLLASSLVIAPVGMILVAKPTIGAAFFVARPSWWAVGGGVILIALAFAVQPAWVADWRDALARPIRVDWHAPHRPPIAYPGGLLVLAALIRWRRPEARLLLALACVPQTTLPYEAVPLFLIPRGFAESATLLALSWGMRAWVQHIPHITMAANVELFGAAFVWFLYLPCVVMVFRRPNEGSLPTWIEQRIKSWPAWLRGATLERAW